MAEQLCEHCGQVIYLTGPYRNQWRHAWSRTAVCVIEATYRTVRDEHGERARATPAG